MASMRRTRTIPPSRQGDVLPAPAPTAPVPRTPDRLMDDATLEELVADVRSEKARYYLRTLARERTMRKACAVADIAQFSVWRWRQGDPAFATAEAHLLRMAEDARRMAYEETLDDIALGDRNLLGIFFGLKKMDPSYRDNYQPPPQQAASQTFRWQTEEEARPAIEAEYRIRELPEHAGDGEG